MKLKKGSKTVIVTNSTIIAVLKKHGFEEIKAAEEKALSQMNKAELIAKAEQVGVQKTKTELEVLKNAEIKALIEEKV